MPSNPPSSEGVAFTPEFKRNVRQLSKKYRHIQSDLQPLIDQLSRGDRPGDQISGVRFDVFKVRLKNSDAARGKSGGYRIIYYVAMEGPVVLVTIYSKTEQADIAPAEIRHIIEAFAAEAAEEPGQEPEAGADEKDDAEPAKEA